MSLALRLARRDLRGGWAGLGLLWLCLALSVAGLAAVLSLGASIDRAMTANGRAMLGGDLLLSITQRKPTDEERRAIADLGAAEQAMTLRAMIVTPRGDSALSELTAAGRGWPAAGTIAFEAGVRRPEAGEIALDPGLAARLAIEPGATVRVGRATLRVSGLIESMPRGGGFALAPTALVGPEALAASGLDQRGSLVTTSFRLRLPVGTDAGAAGIRFQRRFADAGWRAITPAEAAVGTKRLIERLGQMLQLIALAALGIGAVGLASAADAFAESRRPRVAILKLVGASRRTLLAMLGTEVALVALSAIAVALLIGAATPALVGPLMRDLLPVAPDPSPDSRALLLSLGFAALVTIAACWRPLAEAVSTRPLSLLRGALGEGRGSGAWGGWAAGAAAVVLVLLAADDRRLAAYGVGALAALAFLFVGLGWLVRLAARRLRHRGGPIVRLGVGALDRPGAPTARLMLSLGLGLSLLVALAASASSLLASIRSESAARAPALFVLDIPKDRRTNFEAVAARTLPGAELRLVPSLRGPVVAVNGTRVVDLPAIPEGAWVLRGDRGLTFAATPPADNRIVAGQWWPADYTGPPLISLDADAAEALGLKIGDSLTVAVLGRPITARIASLRRIAWRSLGFNFAIIFDPHTLRAAPFTWMASVATPRPTAAFERALPRALPMTSSIRIADVVAEIARLLDAISGAVRIAAVFAVAIGMVVLAGSVVATRSARQRDIVLLRLVGATRRQLLASQGLEYLLIAAAAALGAMAAGLAAAYAVSRWLFDLPFQPDWPAVIALPLAAIILASAAALLAAWPALAMRPAAGLR